MADFSAERIKEKARTGQRRTAAGQLKITA
jgi:hypothetical protein